MPIDALLTSGVLGLTFFLLMKTELPPPAIFMGALTVSLTLKLAPTPELLKGFNNEGMLTVAVLFIVAAGMYATGAITILMEKLIGKPKSSIAAKLKILPPIATGSAFLNNTPLVAMMIPVIRDLCRTSKLPAKHLYIPLSFASILGGTCTIIGTSTNLVIAGLVTDAIREHGDAISGLRPLRMFDPGLVGIPLALIGVSFMIFFGRFLLPDRDATDEIPPVRRRYTAEFLVREGSRIAGKTISDAGFSDATDCDLISVTRNGKALTADPAIRLAPGDLLTFSTEVEALIALWRSNTLRPHVWRMSPETKRHGHQLVKVTVAKESNAIGRRVKSIPGPDAENRFNIVAISRGGEAVAGPLEEVRVRPGDNAVLEVCDSFLYQTQLDKNFNLTKPLDGYHLQRTDKAVEASVITLTMIAVVAIGWMSMLNAGLLACAAMLFTRCITFSVAAKSIDWGTLVVIACAIGLESAVTRSGLAQEIATLLTAIGGKNPYIALFAIFMGGMFMTNVITNNAAAAFMFPIALSAATQLQVSPMPFIIALMISASCAFITPTGYQTNLMVWAPGGYSFGDFVKIGTIMTLIVGVCTMGLTPLFFRF